MPTLRVCETSLESLTAVRTVAWLGLERSVVSLTGPRTVTAICSGQDSGEDPDPPDEGGEPTSVLFSWDAVEGAVEEYVIAVGTAEGLSDVGTYHTGSTDVDYLLTLNPGTYYARVSAVIDGVTGDPSADVTVTV